ncbi:Dienelactone hydrolase protein [Rutstroemia sp. NJR-2017a BBW]|nr:Dienelactone hydrolase protein [Rutstroemia sp. NJR-2017a BBW]
MPECIACSDCLRGTVQAGTPKGTVSNVHGLPTYTARPESDPRGVIVLIPDIFGWELANPRLLADTYAREGRYLVYLPEFMNGQAASASTMHAMDGLFEPSSLWETILYKPYYIVRVLFGIYHFFLSKSLSEATIKPLVFNYHSAIRNAPETAGLPLGSAGLCWGGKYTTLLCQEDDLVDAGFTAHPSNVKFPDDWAKVKKPLSVCIGDVDKAVGIEEVKQIKALLEEKEATELVILEGAKHGFAVRADPADEGQMKSAEIAKKQALAWYSKWFAQG